VAFRRSSACRAPRDAACGRSRALRRCPCAYLGPHAAPASQWAGLWPRLVAGVFGALASLATKDWRACGGGSVASTLAAFDAYADQVGPALAGHWS